MLSTSISIKQISLTIFTLFSLVASSLAASRLSSSSSTPSISNEPHPRATKPFLLRVMPLGASITVGYRSSDGNGYRKFLREQLRYAGWEVDMVGSLNNGTMKDHQNEGHYGDTIDGVANAGIASAWMQPNVILINAGTNDAIRNDYIRGAGERIDRLITDLLTRIPNTTIILSTLIANTHAQRVIQRMSQEYRNVVARRRAAGDRVVLAEMSYFVGSEYLVGGDGTHPDDAGYKAMAAVWWAAILEAEREGLLAKPNAVQSGLSVLVGSGNGTEGEGLDDGPVRDPGLPNYIAPAQPGEDGAARVGAGMVWAILGVPLGLALLRL
ncbi:SGNH/GDSL hydrolase family protein [Aspergillus lucknowensis]|uniref:SGNH hydrolase-type esterase domain-containing protein n=1 Tax=Aspergillus lucknowensis TaxID=176173 RepID=A0ABR4LR93_9EURO